MHCFRNPLKIGRSMFNPQPEAQAFALRLLRNACGDGGELNEEAEAVFVAELVGIWFAVGRGMLV